MNTESTMTFRAATHADTPALVREFGGVVLEELSYLHEAANARKFAAMYERDNTVYIPSIYDALSTDRILTTFPPAVSTIQSSRYSFSRGLSCWM